MKRVLPFPGWTPILAGALLGVALRLLFSGRAGDAYTAMSAGFIYFVPGIVGAVTVYMAERKERRSWGYYVAAPILANLLFVLGTMAILVEGIICAVIIAPLFAILGAVGGIAMGAICRLTNWPGKALYCAGILPFVLGSLDPAVASSDEVGVIERSTTMHAGAQRVWRDILDVPDIAPKDVDQAWLYRIGVPLPKSGISGQRDGRPVRRVTMGKNVYFDEVITDWDEGRYLRWIYRYYPDSFPPYALDEHVVLGGQYFDITETSYRLVPMGDATRVSVTMKYRVTTRFNWYAGPLARFLLGNLAEVNLEYYRRRSESPAPVR